MTTTTPDPATAATDDRLAILELIGSLALSLDARDWDALEGLFIDPVYYDRTSRAASRRSSVPRSSSTDTAKRVAISTPSTTSSPAT
jgi:hypothetical protein